MVPLNSPLGGSPRWGYGKCCGPIMQATICFLHNTLKPTYLADIELFPSIITEFYSKKPHLIETQGEDSVDVPLKTVMMGLFAMILHWITPDLLSM